MQQVVFGMIFMLWTSVSFSQVSTHELLPVSDTYVSKSKDHRNYGADVKFEIGHDLNGHRVLMKLDDVAIRSLLAENELVSATLELPIYKNKVKHSETITLHKLLLDWTEDGATGDCPIDTNTSNNKDDCGEEWNLFKSFWKNRTLSYDASSIASASVVKNQEMPIGISLESYVNELNSGAVNNGFVILRSRKSLLSHLEIFSKEAGVKPKLILKVKPIVTPTTTVTAKLNANVVEGQSPLLVNFDASSSLGDIQSMSLDLGNGETITLDKKNPKASFEYLDEGSYQAVLSIQDSEGAVSYSSVEIAVFDSEGKQKDKHYGYWIKPNESMKVDYKSGESATISGDICKVWKSHLWKDEPKCHPINNTELQIQVFFPDMVNPISSELNVTKVGHKREFSFTTKELDKNDLNTLTILVGELDKKVIHLGGIKSKLQRRILALDKSITRLRSKNKHPKIIEILENVKYALIGLNEKIDERNAKEPTILAQYNIPIQVDNKVSASRYYSTMMGGFRIELSSDIGNIFEGDYAHFKSRVTNLSHEHRKKPESFSFNYTYKGDDLQSIPVTDFGIGKVHEFSFVDSAHSNLNELHRFALDITEQHYWGKHKLASSKTHLPVILDDVAPKWLNTSSEIIYAQEFPKLEVVAKDELGRLDISTLLVQAVGVDTTDITSYLTPITPDLGSEYHISGDVKEVISSEGSFQIKYSIADFKGQKAIPEPYVKTYQIDRTPPVMFLSLVDSILTKENELNFNVNIVDSSPTELTLYHNGRKVNTYLDKNNDVRITLHEGQNIIEARVVDKVGLEGAPYRNENIFLDTVSPVLTLNSEIPLSTQEDDFILGVDAKDENLKNIKINLNGLEILSSIESNVVKHFEFSLGQNLIEVIAEDKVGNISKISRTVTYEVPAPSFDHELSKIYSGHIDLDFSRVSRPFDSYTITVVDDNQIEDEVKTTTTGSDLTTSITLANQGESEICVEFHYTDGTSGKECFKTTFNENITPEFRLHALNQDENDPRLYLVDYTCFDPENSVEKSFVDKTYDQETETIVLDGSPVLMDKVGIYDLMFYCKDSEGKFSNRLMISKEIDIEPIRPLAAIELAQDQNNPLILNIISNNSEPATSSTTLALYTFEFESLVEANNFALELAEMPEQLEIPNYGEWTIRFYVTDNLGSESKAQELLFNVSDPNLAPVVNFTINKLGELPELYLNLDASMSKVDNGVLKYVWRFEGPSLIETQNSIYTKKITASGYLNIHLTIYDQAGFAGYLSKKIYIDVDSNLEEIEEQASPVDFLVDTLLKPYAQGNLLNELPYIALGNEIRFEASNSFSYIGSIVLYKWDFGDGNIIETTIPEVAYTYQTVGNFTPKLIVVDSNGLEGSDLLIPVEVAELQLAVSSFTLSESSGEAPFTVKVDVTTSLPSAAIKEYQYFFGDGSFIISPNATIEHTYMQQGQYEISVEVIPLDDNIESATSSKFVGVEPRDDDPVINLLVSKESGKAPFAVTFDASSSTDDFGIVEYRWNFGDGSEEIISESLSLTSHLFQSEGDFPATLTLVDTTGQVSTKTVNIKALSGNLHSGEFTYYNHDRGHPQTIVLDASFPTDDIYEYRWDINGDAVVTRSPVLFWTINSAEDLSVTLVVKDLETNIETLPNQKIIDIADIQNNSYLTFSSSDTLTPANINFKIHSSESFDSFRYIIDDALILEKEGDEFTHQFIASGLHSVKVELLDQGVLKNTVQTQIAAGKNKKPLISLNLARMSGFTPAEQIIQNIRILDELPIVNSEIQWGDNSLPQDINSQTEVSHIYSNAGGYIINIVAEDNKGEKSILSYPFEVIFDNQAPVANFDLNKTEGNPYFQAIVDASASSDDIGIRSYIWNFGDGSAPIQTKEETSEYTYKNPGTYNIHLTVFDSHGSSSSVQKIIRVNASPKANFTYSVTGSTPPFTLNVDGSSSTDDSDGLTYRWYLNDQLESQGSSPLGSFSVNKAGDQVVKLEVEDKDGLVHFEQKRIRLNTPPKAHGIVSPLFADYPALIQFNANQSYDDSGIVSYQWILDSTAVISSNVQGAYLFEEEGMHLLQLKVTDSQGLIDTRDFHINILANPLPVPNFAFSMESAMAPALVKFDAGLSYDDKLISKYVWTVNGQTLQTTSPKFEYVFENHGDYEVVLKVVDSQNSEAQLTKTVSVAQNLPPVANLSSSVANGQLPLSVSFDASGSVNDDESTYHWDFGDGVVKETNESSTYHTFTKVGTYTVTLTVADRKNQTSQTSIQIIVEPNLKNDFSVPTIMAEYESQELLFTTPEIAFSLYDDEGIDFSKVRVFKNSQLLDVNSIEIDEVGGFLKLLFNETNLLVPGQKVEYTIKVTDVNGNQASKAYTYQVIDQIEIDQKGPIVNFKVLDTEKQSEKNVKMVFYDKNNVDLDTLSLVFNDTQVSRESYTLNENEKSIELYLNGELSLLQGNLNSLSVTVFDLVGNSTFATFIFDTREEASTSLSLSSGTIRLSIDSSNSGENMSCVIAEETMVKCWGSFTYSIDGTNTQRYGDDETLENLPGYNLGGKVVEVVTSAFTVCALREDGKVFCWGLGAAQLGTGQGIFSLPQPTLDSPLELGGDAVALYANSFTLCAKRIDGKFVCWGNEVNGSEAIGDNEPILPNGLANFNDTNIKKLSLNGSNSLNCYITEDSKAKCWSRAINNQIPSSAQFKLGMTHDFSQIPYMNFGEPIKDIVSVNGIATCVHLESDNIKCFGNNFGSGILGYPGAVVLTYEENNLTLGYVDIGEEIISLKSGPNHLCSLLKSENLICWGNSSGGILGQGNLNKIGFSESISSVPTIYFGGETVKDYFVGGNHTCANLSNDELYCWGRNNNGQLGLGHTNNIGDNELPFPHGKVTLPSSGQGSGEGELIAKIISNPESGEVPLVVSFDGTSSTSTAGEITKYLWNFGDGNTIEETTGLVQHTYNEAGSFIVNLTVTDNQGNQVSVQDAINVLHEPILPVAQFTVPDSAKINESVSFDGSNSYDAFDPIESYFWDFGDGQNLTTLSPSAEHTYNAPGTYSVKLIVSTANKQSEVFFKNIVINPYNEAPIANMSCSQEEYLVSCNAFGVIDFDGTIEKVEFDFGDGARLDGENVAHQYASGGLGRYVVTLNVYDNMGAVASKNQEVVLDDMPPILSSNLTSNLTLSSNQLPFNLLVEDDSRTVTEIYVNNSLYLTTEHKSINDYLVMESGNNTVRITSRDLAGNISSDLTYNNLVLVNDTPIITSINESDVLVNSTFYILNLTVHDDGATKTSVLLNNEPLFQDIAQKSISESITLQEGINNIQAIVFDEENKFDIINISNIKVDTVAPQFLALSPADGSNVFGKNSFKLKVEADEVLSKVELNGQELPLQSDGKSVDYDVKLLVEGEVEYLVTIFDLAGNATTETISLNQANHLIYKNLISLTPENGKLRLKGFEGATRFPNQELEIKTGFFSSLDITSNADGSFETLIDFISSVDITAIHHEWAFEETVTITTTVDTTFAGIIKDVNGVALPGVTVKFSSGGESVQTDASGSFSFPSPPLGEQSVIIDATTVPEEASGLLGNKYSKLVIDVNISSREPNILDRVIYLAPIKINRAQVVEIDQDSYVAIDGVEIEIPAFTATFPGGTEVEIDDELKHVIDVSEVPIERTSIPVFEEAVPDKVFALEPSGLTFSQPVKITLPNVNEFAEGTRLVVFSKDSKTGTWGIDGAASVVGGKVVTDENQGVTHFSEVFVAPYGLEITNMGDNDKPGVTTDEGAVSTGVALPSFKVFGQDITPNFVYKSTWQKPNAVITNIFNLVRDYQVERITNTEGNLFGTVKTTTTIETWTTPEEIKSSFIIDNTELGENGEPTEAFFNATKAPEKAVVSYAVDLDHLSSGVYAAKAKYTIKYKHLTLITVDGKSSQFFGSSNKKITNDDLPDDFDTRIENYSDFMPADIDSNVYVQNKSNSEFGSGWKFGLTQQIANPGASRLMVEEENGAVSGYVLDNTIETLVYDESGIEAANLNSSNKIYYYSSDNQLKEAESFINADNKLEYTSLNLVEVPKHEGGTGVNLAYWRKKRTLHDASGKRYFKHSYTCEIGRFDFTSRKEILAIIPYNGELYYLDKQGAIYKNDLSNESIVSGVEAAPPALKIGSHKQRPEEELQQFCQFHTHQSCPSDRRVAGYSKRNKIHYDGTRSWRPGLWRCNSQGYPIGSSGKIPRKGFAQGALTSSVYSSPMDFVASKTESGVFYVADRGNNVVRKINLNTNQTTIVAGNRQTNETINVSAGSLAINVAIREPRGLATDKLGNLYISSASGLIRKVDINGVISILAGRLRHLQANPRFDSTLDRLFLRNPSGLAFDDTNNYLYVADTSNNRIVRLDLNTNLTTQIAGNSKPCARPDENGNYTKENPYCLAEGLPATQAGVNAPVKIGLDENNDLLILDRVNKRVRRVNFKSSGTSGLVRYKPLNIDNTTITKNLDGTYIREYRNGSKVVFSAEGLHLKTLDRLGNTNILFGYTDEKLTEVTTQNGETSTLSYGADGLLESFKDYAQRETRFFYIGGKLTEIVFSDNTTRKFTYHPDTELLEQSINARNFATTFVYDSRNRLKEVVSPEQHSNSIDFGIGYTFGAISPEDASEITSYEDGNVDGNELGDVYKDANDVEYFTKKDFSGFIEEIRVKDDDGNIQVLATIERDNQNRPVSIKDREGVVTTFAYNRFGDLVEKYSSDTALTEKFDFNELGNLTKYTNVKGHTKTNIYDPITGLLIEEIDYNGNKIVRSYDNLLGLLISVDAVNNGVDEKVIFSYGIDGNLKSKTLPQRNETVSYERDTQGNITKKIDAKGIWTLFSYDDFNRILSVAPGVLPSDSVEVILSKTTSYTYTPTGQLETILDPYGNLTRFEYDKEDRLVKKISPLGQITVMDHDGVGNVIYTKDPNENEFHFKYTAENLLKEKILPDKLYTFEYFSKGDLKTVTAKDLVNNTTDSIHYTYEQKNGERLVASEELVTSVFSGPLLNNYQHDDLGNRTLLASSYGNFQYSYTPNGQLKKVINHLGEVFNFGFDSGNRLSNITRLGKIVTTYGFDKNSFLTTLSHKVNNNLVDSYLYTRDDNGNRSSIINRSGSSTFLYDLNSQLKEADIKESSSLEKYTYDFLGNRKTDELGEYTYGEKLQRLESDYRYQYHYDNNGNMTSRIEKSNLGNFTNYIYNSENQLINIETYVDSIKVKTVNYHYGPLGRRLQKEIIDHQDLSKNYSRKYHYDGQEILAEYDENETLLGVYTHSGLRTDDVLAVDVRSNKLAQTPGTYVYLKDALGSIIDITDSDGSIVQHYAYSSFGQLIKISNSSGDDITVTPIVKTSYGFTNREHDEESGMMYYRARYYMPEIGRFVSEDEHPGSLTTPKTHLSKYIYVANNPIKFVDPSGKFFVALGVALLKSVVLPALVSGIASAVIASALSKKGGFFENLTGGVGQAAFVGGFQHGLLTGGIGFGVGALSQWLGATLQTANILGGVIGGIAGGVFALNKAPNSASGTDKILLFILGASTGATIGVGASTAGYGFMKYLTSSASYIPNANQNSIPDDAFDDLGPTEIRESPERSVSPIKECPKSFMNEGYGTCY